MKDFSKTRALLNMAVGVLLLILTAEYGGSRLAVIETLEQQSYDWRLQRESAVKQNDIVIVDIDRDSLRKYGNWPFDRNLFAKMNRQLFNKYRVKIVAYALPFSRRGDNALALLDNIEKKFQDSDNSPANTFGSNTVRENYLIRRKIATLREQYNYDQHVIDTIRDNPVVLGHIFDESGRIEGALPPPVKLTDNNKNSFQSNALKSMTREWRFYTGYSGNLNDYLLAAKNHAGHINFDVDKDGITRRAPYLISHLGAYYPSLPIAVYQRLTKTDTIALDTSGNIFRSLRVGNRKAAMNSYGDMYINYLGSGGQHVNFDKTADAVFRYVSFAEVVEGKVPPEQLDDKIIFVGSSSEQLPYLYPTPVNSVMPGVEILATQLANLMNENILQRNNTIALQELLFIGLSVIILSALFTLISPLFALLTLLGLLIGYTYWVFFQWTEHFAFWALTPVFITLIGLFVFSMIIGFIIEWRNNRQLQSTFGQYVPPEFAKKIGESGNSINLEGEGRELSILFSDVRNFTSISESLSPRELTLLMNRMLTDLTEVIHAHGGTVDKYIGDAIMAFWNAPLYNEEHAPKSVLAALDMQKAMQTLSEELEKDGFPNMRLGVGICTGDANVGNMGSKLRMTYTAIGDTVNLASRTESLTKYYQCPILVTDSTHEQCKDAQITFRTVDLVRVKGRQTPVTLYQPVGQSQLLEPGTLDMLHQFEEMHRLYVSGDFSGALGALESYRQKAPNDELAQLYHERLQLLLKNPPANWDGIMTHQAK